MCPSAINMIDVDFAIICKKFAPLCHHRAINMIDVDFAIICPPNNFNGSSLYKKEKKDVKRVLSLQNTYGSFCPSLSLGFTNFGLRWPTKD